jgi:Spy/CpxP family protein refolding chaperone
MQEIAMENNSKGRWGIRAAVLGIFLLGCLAGALSMNIYRAHFARFPGQARGERFERMLDRLSLTANQRTEVEQILKDSRSQIVEIRRQSEPRYREIRKEADRRLQNTLTPQQWQQWQEMANEMRGRGRRFRGSGL